MVFICCVCCFLFTKMGRFFGWGAAKVVVFCIWGRGGRIHNSTARTPLLHNPRIRGTSSVRCHGFCHDCGRDATPSRTLAAKLPCCIATKNVATKKTARDQHWSHLWFSAVDQSQGSSNTPSSRPTRLPQLSFGGGSLCDHTRSAASSSKIGMSARAGGTEKLQPPGAFDEAPGFAAVLPCTSLRTLGAPGSARPTPWGLGVSLRKYDN